MRLVRCAPVLLVLLLVLGGCASTAPHPQLYGEEFLRTELFFGLSVQEGPGGEVTSAEWQNFVDTQITPRFPDGLTVVDTYGQWLYKGDAVKEKGKLLIVVHPVPAADGPNTANKAIEDIIHAYKTRFHQDSVLRVTTLTHVAF